MFKKVEKSMNMIKWRIKKTPLKIVKMKIQIRDQTLKKKNWGT